MWTCYERKTETGGDIAYILLADDHPGEAAIKTVMVEPLQKKGLPSSVEDTIKSLMPAPVSQRAFSKWPPARRAQSRYGRNES